MISLKNLKTVHMVGIKGTGMSSLDLALRSLGVVVTGSDSADSFLLLDERFFKKAGITIADGFDAKNISDGIDAIIASSSHLSKNVEINKARKLKIPILTYAEAVGLLTREFKTIAVCGSHGKTTTTNLLGHVLKALTIAGPTSPQNIAPYPPLTDKRGNKGEIVLEADEYENKLKHFFPNGVILTNIDWDHPDYFKTKASYEKVFVDFVKRIPKDGFLVYREDDEVCRRVAEKAVCKRIPYTVRTVNHTTLGTPFAVQSDGKTVGVFRTSLMGQHNALNAAAVVLAARELGISEHKIQEGLMSFRGSPRRLQKISDTPLVYDDYGHHPTEIKATLQALRSTFQDRKIWAVFHPHTFTRTKQFLKEFGAAFEDADRVIVLEIYGSAREKKGTISSKDVVKEIQKNKGTAQYAENFEDAAKLLHGKLSAKTLLLTRGAGDVWKLHKLL